MRSTLLWSMLVAAVLWGWPMTLQAQRSPVDLRPKFEKGQQIKLRLETEAVRDPQAAASNPGTKRPGQPPAKPPRPTKPTRDHEPDLRQPDAPAGKAAADGTSMKQEMVLVLRVKDADPLKGAEVDLTYESLKMSVTSPEFSGEYDSTKPKPPPARRPAGGGDGIALPSDFDDPLAMIGQMIVGQTLTLKVDADGKITSISGGQGIAGALGGGVSGGAPKDLFGSIFTPKAGKPTAEVGESWENVDVIDTGVLGKFKMTMRHTLRSAAGREAAIDLKGRIEPESVGGAGGTQVQDSTITGQYIWDTARGMIKRMETKQEVTILPAASAVSEEATGPQRWKQSVKVTRVD